MYLYRPSGFESVCRPAQNNLVDCYNENPGKPLACYKQLNQFKQCVADTKMVRTFLIFIFI